MQKCAKTGFKRAENAEKTL